MSQQAAVAPPAPQEPVIPTMPAEPGAATAGGGAVTVGGQGGAGGQGGGLLPGQATTSQPPPFQRDEFPDEIIPLVGMTLGILMTIIILFPIARAIGRAIDRRTDRSLTRIADIAPQLRTLQESVDTMAIELERISEAQRFTAKLMAGEGQKLGAGQNERA